MSEHYQHDERITSAIVKDIEEHKLHVAFVDGDGYNPKFGYSIGLYKSYNQAEIIVFGLNPESTGQLLNSLKEQLENGTKFLTGIEYPDFIENHPIQFVEVKFEHYPDYLGYCGWFNNNSFDFPVLQMVWPDNQGNFPWSENFNSKFKFVQPLLDRNIDFKFLEERNLGVFTTKDVLEGSPVLFVYHDENGDWQFHSTENPNENDAKLVCLSDLTAMDNTLNEIYYLNYGESACRNKIGDKWKVFERTEDNSSPCVKLSSNSED